MIVRNHHVMELDNVSYNYLSNDALPPIMALNQNKIFGSKRGMGIALVSLTGMGKTHAMLGLPHHFEYCPFGETLDIDGQTVVGYPANVENLNKILAKSDGSILIDSMSNLHPGKERLGSKGIDLSLFECMQEIHLKASVNGHVVFMAYNPIEEELFVKSQKEVAGRLRCFIMMLPQFQCQVQNPLTRKLSKVMPNSKVWWYLTEGYKADESNFVSSTFLRM